MRALVVVDIDPVANYPVGVLQALETVAMDALLFHRPDQSFSFNQPVLLRCVGRDELLLQSIAFDQCRIAPTGKDQAIVQAEQEGFPNLVENLEAGSQGLFQGGLCSF